MSFETLKCEIIEKVMKLKLLSNQLLEYLSTVLNIKNMINVKQDTINEFTLKE